MSGIGSALAAAALLGWTAMAAAGQPARVPRLANHKPDLGGSGVWFPPHVSDLVEAGVEVPFLPWAKAKFLENRARRENDPDLKCLPSGIPRITLSGHPFEIVQMPGRIVFVYEGGSHVWRNVWMDGRPHPKDPNPDWLGDAIGHWEGDTLVVDSVGFNDRSWLDDAGHPHTEQLHVIEKYTRTGPLAMKYEAIIDDPGAYTQGWTISASIPFRSGERLLEYLCVDGQPDPRATVSRGLERSRGK